MRAGWIMALIAGPAMAACVQVPKVETAAPSASSDYVALTQAAFGPLAALAGTRWYGEPGDADVQQGQPPDYAEWYWDLGGTTLVNRHVLADGTYGGVTYIRMTPTPGELTYSYFTSARFSTEGIFKLNADGSWSAEEELAGLDHIDRIRSTGRLNADGTMVTLSEFHSPEEGWKPGHSFVYTRTDKPLPELVPEGYPVPEEPGE